MTTKRPQIGDVFSAPVGTGYAIGQVHSRSIGGPLLWFTFFAPVMSQPPTLEESIEITRQRPILFGVASSAALSNGTWTVLANLPVNDDFPKPTFLSREALAPGREEFFLKDVFTGRKRPASEFEKAAVPNFVSVSPVSFQNTLLAHHEGRDLAPHQKALLIDNFHPTEVLFPPIGSNNKNIASTPQAEEEMLIISMDFIGDAVSTIREICREIDSTLQENHSGELDGFEVAEDGSDGFLYLFGPSALQIKATVHEIFDARSDVTHVKFSARKVRM